MIQKTFASAGVFFVIGNSSDFERVLRTLFYGKYRFAIQKKCRHVVHIYQKKEARVMDKVENMDGYLDRIGGQC